MLIQRSYKTRIVVNNHQDTYLRRCAGAARFVFNWALADRIARYEDGKQLTNRFEQKKRFNALKHDQFPWLADMPYALQAQEFTNVEMAFQNFRRRLKTGEKPGFPKFKSRHSDRLSFTLRGSIHVQGDRIHLTRIGWLRLAEHDYLPTVDSKILSVNINHYAGKWYVSLQVEEEIPDPTTPDGEPLGIDVGIKALAICSDGQVFENPKALTLAQRKLKRASRELSRRHKGGANWQKTRAKIARLHERVANVRRNTQHEASHYVIAQKPAAVVLEDLNIKGMLKNHHLAHAISDAGFGELRRQIEYKASWNGIQVVRADRWFPSSKTCSQCGSIRAELGLDERIFRCPECGLEIDRDLNAAKNLAALVNRQNGRGLPVELGCSNASL